MLFVASTLMWTCNTMYIIDMPLWISSELGLPDKLAGFLMGTAAGLEIPAMILAGYYVNVMVAANDGHSSGGRSTVLHRIDFL
ncbi:broad specificity sugar efflux system [Escherichia coli]|uniref:Broad specificity sugar efflux system n=1 Tax=Escherichia coli TaxID=562 RepID=A0A2X1NIN8_ECOLX|nr:broad specificity sugar efflux system [Escherichia coli]